MSLAIAAAAGALFATGSYMLLRRNLVRVVIGIALVSNGANLVIFSAGELVAGSPPLVAAGAKSLGVDAADPLPQAFVLTAIVITFALQAFALALAYAAYERTDTSDPQTLTVLDVDEEDEP